MPTKDKRVDTYISAAPDFAKPILRHLRALIHDTCPDVSETIKWRFPHFEYQGMFCSMASFKHHCAFGFWKAKLMEKYAEVLGPNNQSAMGHFGQLTTVKDLPSGKILVQLIKEAMRINEEGVKVTRPKPIVNRKLTIPAYFKKELAKNNKATNTFEKFSYTNKKDYVEWVVEAKTESTRQKRMATAIEWLAEGKTRHWKYAM